MDSQKIFFIQLKTKNLITVTHINKKINLFVPKTLRICFLNNGVNQKSVKHNKWHLSNVKN